MDKFFSAAVYIKNNLCNFLLQADKEFIVTLLEDQLSSPKDHPSYLTDLYTKQLETGDYGPPLESISEISDAVFVPPTQSRQVNNNNNTAPTELFNPSAGTLTPELLSPLYSANGEISGRQTWNNYASTDPLITDTGTAASANE